VTRDLTSRRQAEDERIRLGKAQEAVRLRDEFLSIASHELKTPLTALLLQLEGLAANHGGESRLARRVERALESGQRRVALVESLLDVSRLTTIGVDLQLESFDLAARVAAVVRSLEPAAATAGCALTLRRSGPMPGVWDPTRVDQVVTNVLANAFKYGAGTPATVALWLDGPHAVIEVADHGPGIAERDRVRIFERFERRAAMENYGGLGLGLFISREIVTAHGGTIAADSAEGGGARFTIRLPLVPPPRAP
jgi:signal transduction histidine kinase